MSALSRKQILWAALFLLWAPGYLCLATAFGVFALYVAVEFPTLPQTWIMVGAWAVAGTAGAWLLVFLMKRAFDERDGQGNMRAQNR